MLVERLFVVETTTLPYPSTELQRLIEQIQEAFDGDFEVVLADCLELLLLDDELANRAVLRSGLVDALDVGEDFWQRRLQRLRPEAETLEVFVQHGASYAPAALGWHAPLKHDAFHEKLKQRSTDVSFLREKQH